MALAIDSSIENPDDKNEFEITTLLPNFSIGMLLSTPY